MAGNWDNGREYLQGAPSVCQNTIAGLTPVSLVKRVCRGHGFTGACEPGTHCANNPVEDRAIVGAEFRAELLGNTSVGKIVRPEFGGQSIARGELRPLTYFAS